MTVFLYAFRERELILDLFEEYCGARLTYNAMRIGGLPLDIPPGWDAKVRALLRHPRDEGRRVRRAADPQPHLARSDARLGVIGGDRGHCHRPERSGAARLRRAARRPQGRALRGVCRLRLRRADRHDRRHLRSLPRADRGVPPVHPHHPAGARRAAGRADHRQGAAPASSRRPAKPITRSSRRRERSATSSSATASRTRPYRFRVRPPSFCNLQALPRLVKGHLVSDVVALIGSIDIVLGEVDR